MADADDVRMGLGRRQWSGPMAGGKLWYDVGKWIDRIVMGLRHWSDHCLMDFDIDHDGRTGGMLVRNCYRELHKESGRVGFFFFFNVVLGATATC